MRHCAWCRKPFIPDLMGMNEVFLQFFDEDGFLVHEHCGEEILLARDKFKTKKAKVSFMLACAKKMSNGGGGVKEG